MTISSTLEKQLVFLTPDEALAKLTLPNGLKAQQVDVGRRVKLERSDSGGYSLRLNSSESYPILREEAMDSIIDAVKIPKRLAKTSPEKLLYPLVEHHLRQQERLMTVTDDGGLVRLFQAVDPHPVMTGEQVLETMLKSYPEVKFQHAMISPTDGDANLLAITRDEVQRLETLLQPGTYISLPKEGEAFRGGLHVCFNSLGLAAPKVEPYLVRLVCTNGAVHAQFVSQWGRGYGEGDDLWQWFRQGIEAAHASMDEIFDSYAHMVGEALPDGAERTMAVEGLIRQARLPKALANALRDRAIGNPPQTMYDLWNHFTAIATHYPADLQEQIGMMTTAGKLAQETHHRFCVSCGRN